MTIVVPVARRISALFALVVCSAFLGAELIRQPTYIRFLAAACIGLAAVIAAMQWPRAALVATLLLLPYLALTRRLLLEFTPWKSTDPMLLVAPAVLLLVLARLFILERRPLVDNRLAKLVLFVVAITLLEAVNPRGGGIKAGVGALLFTAVPVLWFFAGEGLATRHSMRILLAGTVLSASLISIYGLAQTWDGMPSWDRIWTTQTGYAALSVGQDIRAFGTLSSAAEYGTFLGAGIAIAIAFALDRRPYLLPTVPLLAVALFYESSRGTLVATVVAVLVVLAARTGSMRRAAVSLVGLLAIVVVALVIGRGALLSASSSSNALVAHQVSGFAHPLNSTQSTLPSHLTLIENGFTHGALDPIGHGIGSTTLAGSRLGNSQTGSSELDLSNAFIATGTFGGLAYLALVFTALAAMLRQAVIRRDAVSLAVLGMGVAALGQWENGGFYALSPLIWFAVGFTAMAHGRPTAEAADAPAGHELSLGRAITAPN